MIRSRIAGFCEAETPFQGIVEVDESYFGAKRIRGQRGRGAAGKTPVFGILHRQGKVSTEIVPDCTKATVQGIIRGKVSPDSIIHSDGWRGYSGLVDIGYKKHYSGQHGNNEFARGKKHINGMESFGSFAKNRLIKFHGISQKTFYLHLKECAFRVKQRDQNLYAFLLKMFREKPLN